ncbi:secretory carrier-associated membrane protein [Paragonimus westermani]|uniref:Secretory carrier-associated membrane protein n=2 Tax=Paragonimus TaxID=34503 RepID=A0A5J4P0A4_9TREM|nr:secretory carrier-associated membrane protein [Paragonimus westermani]
MYRWSVDPGCCALVVSSFYKQSLILNTVIPLCHYFVPFLAFFVGKQYGVPTVASLPDDEKKSPFDSNAGSAPPLPPTAFPPSRSMMNNDAILALERRQAELEARAAELDRREKEQQARMAAYQAAAPPHNWPPLPRWCPCKPCVRQDFEADIPLDCRWLAQMGYALWLAYALLLLLNMGGTLGYFIVGSSTVEGPLFGASILLVLVMPPLSFFGWHRPLYKALRSDSSINYVLFFILFAVQTIIVLIQCLGIDYLGSCGWINSLKTCGTNKPVCSFMLVIASLFSVMAALCAFLLFKVHRHYRTSGASLRKAKLEMTSAAAYEASSSFGAMP